jgi:hypothetical protein
MTPILAKVTAIEQRGDQYQVIVQISPKYRGSLCATSKRRDDEPCLLRNYTTDEG